MSTLRTQRSNVRYWPKAAAPAGDCRVRFRGYSCRDAGRVAWQLMTQSGHFISTRIAKCRASVGRVCWEPFVLTRI
jgi:hypothetical protein